MWARPYEINPNAVMKLLIAGRVLLILEGFDEMALLGDAAARMEHFTTLWKFCYPQAKVLFTGRPNYFLDDTELKRALDISSGSTLGPYCEALYLEPFSLDQIQIALRELPVNIQAEILKVATINPKFLYTQR
jgi:hypothetical protein